MKLSIIVLTHNNQAVISGCLRSAQQADEIIVIDDHSTDDTVKLARRFTSKIYSHHLTSFAAQRTWGAKQSKGNWLMFLDADERLTSQLFEEIKAAVNSGQHVAFRFKRQNYFFGQKIKHGGYWPDWQIRLFKRSTFKGIIGASHEQPLFDGSLGSLKHPLLHFADRSVQLGLHKSMIWTKPEAKALYEADHPPITWWRLVKVMLSEFVHRYFKKQGWRDGYVGFVEAITQAINKFFIYQQVWELQHQEEIKRKYQKLEDSLS